MKHLFQPTRLGDLHLLNSVVMAPLTRNRATPSGVPHPYVTDYYSQRSSAGLVITEGTQPSFAGQGYPRTPGIHTPEQIAAWGRSPTPSTAAARRSCSRSCMSAALRMN